MQSVFRDRGESVAFVVGNWVQPQRRVVEVGSYNDVWVEVRSGLEEGETVLLAPPADYPLQAGESEDAEFAADESGESGSSSQGARPVAGSGREAEKSGARSGGKLGRPTAAAAQSGYAEHGTGGAE